MKLSAHFEAYLLVNIIHLTSHSLRLVSSAQSETLPCFLILVYKTSLGIQAFSPYTTTTTITITSGGPMVLSLSRGEGSAGIFLAQVGGPGPEFVR